MDIKHRQQEMKRLLIKWASINSHTFNLGGLDLMAAHLREEFARLEAFETQICSLQGFQEGKERKDFGEILLYQKRKEAKWQVLLSGHYDTVFPKDHPFATVTEKEGKLFGQGVCDMKGGLVVMLYALHLFESLPESKHVGFEVVLSCDEEVGSPISAPHIERLARGKHLALVFEPTLDSDLFASSRSGSLNLAVTSLGRAAHVGRDFESGANAIHPLCKLIDALSTLKKGGLKVNVGTIHGGVARNIVPERAMCEVNIRFEKSEEASFFKHHVETLVHSMNKETKAHLEVLYETERPSKSVDQSTARLIEVVKELSKKQGREISFKHTGGVCDGNNIAAKGVPTLDTLGVSGGGIHTEKEWMDLSSLLEQVELTKSLLLALAKGDLAC